MIRERLTELVVEAFELLLEGRLGRDIRGRAVAAARRMLSPPPPAEGGVFQASKPVEKALMRRRRRMAVKMARRREGLASSLDAAERARKGWITRRQRGGAPAREGIPRLGLVWSHR